MKQNKRFILLVVMVLLANCLFAGLASAVDVKGTGSTTFAKTSDVTLYFDVTEMDPYGAITLPGGYYDTTLTVGHNGDGIFDYGVGWVYMPFKTTETPNTFLVTSSDPTVVAVTGDKYIDTDWYYEYDDVNLRAYKAGTATITVQEGYFNATSFVPKGTSASFKMIINKNTADAVQLVKKPIASNYKVGDKITAALAAYTIDQKSLTFVPAGFGTNDIMAFILGRGYQKYTTASVPYDVDVPTGYRPVEQSDLSSTKVAAPGYFTRKADAEAWLDAYKAFITPKKVRDSAKVESETFSGTTIYEVVVASDFETVTKYATATEYYWSGMVNYRFTDLAWSVSPVDAATVTVANDVATFEFKKAGNVTITASMKDDPTIKASVTYTIDKNPDLPVEEGKLATADGKTSATVKLTKGVAPETFTLKAKDAKVEIVKFKSSNTAVAKIDEKTGVVTIVKDKEGTVQFTGFDKAGNAYTFNLKVKKVPVSKLTVKTKSLTVEAGKTAQIEWTVKPAYAYNPAVKFTSGDKKIATVDPDGVVTAKKAGTTTVTVTPKFAKDTVNPVVVKVKVK
jgi:alpha-L-fucosidase 2